MRRALGVVVLLVAAVLLLRHACACRARGPVAAALGDDPGRAPAPFRFHLRAFGGFGG